MVRRIPQALVFGRLKCTTSIPQITESTLIPGFRSASLLPPKITKSIYTPRATPNSASLHFASTPSQKGLMHRFLKTRGKMMVFGYPEFVTARITLNPDNIKAFNKSFEVKNLENNAIKHEPKKPLTRKGYVPIEKKIQKELTEMRERENELRLLRSQMLTKSQPNLVEIVNNNDSNIYNGINLLKNDTSTNTIIDDELEKENKRSHQELKSSK